MQQSNVDRVDVHSVEGTVMSSCGSKCSDYILHRAKFSALFYVN